MAILIIQSNPVSAEREQEYNDWYDTVHIPEVLRTPGVVSATRYRLSEAQLSPAARSHPYSHIAVYELADPADEAISAIGSAMADGRIGSSELMAADRASAVWDTLSSH